MKQFSKKSSLLVSIVLGIGSIIIAHAATLWPSGQARDNMNFISDIFWNLNPTTGEVAQTLFGTIDSGETAYTQNRSGYNAGDCNVLGMTISYITGSDELNAISTIESNQIVVLSGGNYTIDNDITISGSCIGFVSKGNSTIDKKILFSNASKVIIDDIDTQQIVVTNNEYTNTGNQTIGLTLNELLNTANFAIKGNIQNEITGSIVDNTTSNQNIILTNNDGIKHVNIILQTGDIFLSHLEQSIILDTTNPTFLGTSADNKTITSGGLYNTGISFSFSDTNISGATLNGSTYTGGTVITGEGMHTFVVADKAGNSTGVVFTIDTTQPVFTGTSQKNETITSGGLYNTGISFSFSDTNISGATLNGSTYTGGTVITGEGIHTFVVADKAGNSTGVVFTIDTTQASCISFSPISGAIISGFSLNFSRSCVDTGAGISGQTLNILNQSNTLLESISLSNTGTSFNYTGGSNTYNRTLILVDKAGNTGTIPPQKVIYTKPISASLTNSGVLYQGKYYVTGSDISVGITGNQVFQYKFTGDTTTTNVFLYTGETRRMVVSLSGDEGIKNIQMLYSTGSQSGSVGPISFYVDKTKPSISTIAPTSGRTNKTIINFQWSGADTGAGISGYTLEFRNILQPGLNTIYRGTSTGFTMPIPDGSYEWRVSAIDIAGNIQNTTINTFSIDTVAPTIEGVSNNTYYNTGVTPVFNIGSGVLNGKDFVSGTPITGEGNYTLIVTNDIGTSTTIKFVIDNTKPNILLISPTSGEIINRSNTITFVRNGTDTNFSGYEFNLNGSYAGFFTGVATNNNSITINNIPNDEYIRTIKGIDKAGNSTTATGIKFNIAVVLTGTVTLTGGITVNNIPFTKDNFGVNITTNKSANIFILSNDLATNITSTTIAQTPKTIIITPIGGEGAKTFTIQATNNEGETFTSTVNGYLDISGPTIPGFTGQSTNYSGACTIKWNSATDTGAGLDSYTYSIVKGTSSIKTGTTATTGITLTDGEIGATGSYILYVAAKDKLGNISSSGSMTFIYTGALDTSPDSFSISKEYDADLDEEYESEIITVSGLGNGVKVLASVDEGSLIINGDDVGTTGYVENDDEVQIAIYSSEDYDDLTSGILTIGDKSSTFKVVTISEDNEDSEDTEDDEDSEDTKYSISSLSTTQKLHISIIYNTLSDLYSDDDSQQEDFMLSFKYIVKDRIGEMEDDDEDDESIETLKYLYNLIDKNFSGGSAGSSSSNSKYTAPNGKEYTIKKVDGEYTSTNFIIVKYFGSLNEIKAYIDKNNPKSVYVGGDYAIDQSRSTSIYKAPNGKTYTFFKTTDGRYGSNNFISAKLFTDLSVMKHHIDVNNQK